MLTQHYDDLTLLQEPLSTEELRAYDERLCSLLAALQSEVGEVEGGALAASGSERLQTSDESSEETALQTELGALAVADELGYEVRDALERLRAGTFGVCGACGEWIRRERLQLVPYARVCSSCSRRPGATGR